MEIIQYRLSEDRDLISVLIKDPEHQNRPHHNNGMIGSIFIEMMTPSPDNRSFQPVGGNAEGEGIELSLVTMQAILKLMEAPLDQLQREQTPADEFGRM